LEVAKKFEDAGLKRLHLVDLDGAAAEPSRIGKYWNNRGKNFLVIDFGGG
jgi:phosphoribosylformimino-5-aminoimidazole carboxamide ribotide isomerase